MNTCIFASVGRRIAPALLAASALCGTVGFSSVASAAEVVVVAPRPIVEKVVVAAPRPVVEEVIVAQPRPIVEKVVVAAPRPIVEEVVVRRPRPIVEEVVVGRPRVFAPVLYGPRFHARFYP